MKRVVSSSIITLFVLLAVAATFLYLRNFSADGSNPVEAIPTDAAFFVVYDPAQVSASALEKPAIWRTLSKSSDLKALKYKLEWLDSISGKNVDFKLFYSAGPLYISSHVTSATEFDFLFLKNLPKKQNESNLDELFEAISGAEQEVVKRNYDGNTIREIATVDGKTFSYAISKGIVIASFTSFLVEDALRQLKVGKPLLNEFQNTFANFESTGFDLYININHLPAFLGIFTEAEKTKGFSGIHSFGQWAITGMDFSDDKFEFKGYLSETDSTYFQQCFKGQQPVEKELLKILPGKTAVVNYIGLSDYKTYYQKLSNQYFDRVQIAQKQKLVKSIHDQFNLDIEEKMFEWIGSEYALVITEPSGLNYTNNCYAVIRANKISKAKTTLKSISKWVDKRGTEGANEELYNGHTIGLIRQTGILPALFGDIFNRITKMYYTDIGNYIIFANQASALRSFIDDYRAGALLTKSEHFKVLSPQLPAKCNFHYMVRPSISLYIFKSLTNSIWNDHIDRHRDLFTDMSTVAFQVNGGIPHQRVNGVVNFKRGGRQEGVNQVFSVETDSSVSMRPLLTTDPVSKTRQILFQDNSGALFMVDNSGNIIWKQEITGVILGEIHELDLFRNNTRQFLFNTTDYMYLLDVEGKPVGNYPIRLPAPATTGLSVYDFENRNDPRIYIPCSNNRIYAYLPSGKPLPGWNFQGLFSAPVTNAVRKIVLGGKEVLMINDNDGSMYLVNKSGENVAVVNRKLTVGKNSSVYSDVSGAVVFTDHLGNVVRILPDGTVEALPLNSADADHGFLYQDADNDGDADYIFVTRNELTAYTSNLVMIYRKVFEYDLSGEILLVNLTSGNKAMCIQSHSANKTWLIKMNGDPLTGFPVKGCAPAVMDELNFDGKRNLFVGGNDNRFYVYSVE